MSFPAAETLSSASLVIGPRSSASSRVGVGAGDARRVALLDHALRRLSQILAIDQFEHPASSLHVLEIGCQMSYGVRKYFDHFI